jgi:hypothetical protein
MTTAAELTAEAQRLREFAHFVTDAEVLVAIRELIDELERRARELRSGNFWDAEGPGVPGHRCNLSKLTGNQLLSRAQAYRNMAEGASTAWTKASLHRVAAALEARADARRKPVEEPSDPSR